MVQRMNELPNWLKAYMQDRPHLQVQWWGRTATFEIIEEISESIIRTLELAALVMLALRAGWAHFGWEFVLGLFVIWAIYGANPAFFELHRWLKHVYVVCRDVTSGASKGRVFMFTGSHMLDTKKFTFIADTITGSWPAESYDQTKFQEWWERITGEEMVSVFLDNPSSNHVYVAGKRMSTEFIAAIGKVQGESGLGRATGGDTNVSLIYALLDAWRNGIVSKAESRAGILGALQNE